MRLFIRFIGLSVLLLAASTLAAQEFSSETATARPNRVLSFNGYLKALPSLDFTNLTDDVNFNNIIHNRLNFRYSHSNNLFFVVEVRNRLLTGSMVTDYHDFMKESLKTDNGLVGASFVPASGKNYIWHLNSDRFYADWRLNNWQVRLGRQRINWGINMVSNPNDLFNTYSFFDFDYEERPGADALRIQHYTGDMSRWELAINPAREAEKSVAAMMYAFNTKGIDLQFIAGYYRNRTAVGAGWASHIKESGFKGEVTLFNSLGKMDSATVVAALSLDHLFANGMYGFVEMLYNGGNRSGETNLLLMTEPMSADNIFISKYAITGSVNYPVSPILSASAAAMYMPDLNGFYIMPSLSWSAATNFDLTLLTQYFQVNQYGSPLRLFRPYLQAKWSF
jgi:hypothetical protein